MLYQINQNNVFRMFGYGLQMLVLACCVVQELITFKRKSFDFTVAILLLLISFESFGCNINTFCIYAICTCRYTDMANKCYCVL